MAYCHDELEAPPYQHFRIIYIGDVQIRVRGRPRVVSSYEVTAIASLTQEGKLSKAAVGELRGITRIICCSCKERGPSGILVWIADCGVDPYERVWRCLYMGCLRSVRGMFIRYTRRRYFRTAADRRVASGFLLFFVLIENMF